MKTEVLYSSHHSGKGGGGGGKSDRNEVHPHRKKEPGLAWVGLGWPGSGLK